MGRDRCGGDLRLHRDGDLHRGDHNLVGRLDYNQLVGNREHHRSHPDIREQRFGDPVELALDLLQQRPNLLVQQPLERLELPVMTGALTSPTAEAVESFACFGGSCSVVVQGAGPAGSAGDAAARVRRRLLDWHFQFSRFEPESELSRLNRDPRSCVPVSATMMRFVEAALRAAELTGGLVDPTLVREVEAAGYAGDLSTPPVSAADALRLAPAPRAAGPHPAARWREVGVDRRAGTVTRPPGVQLDSGGVAKGLFGDVLASVLGWHESFAIEAAGDVRLGGSAGLARLVEVTDPLRAGEVLHGFELTGGAVATSGTSRRSWIGPDGRLAHHVLDPATGRPAFTGIVQATALAASGVEAEALAKAALLSGPAGGAAWLPHGGVLVHADGRHDVIEPGQRDGLR